MFTVIAEDSAAVAGLVVAFLGVFIGHTWSLPMADGVASIVIGTILCGVAVFLVYESHGLIVGESADPDLVRHILQITKEEPAITRASRALTMQLGPDEILVTLDVSFRNELTSSQVVEAVERLEAAITRDHPKVSRIFVEARALHTLAR